MKRRNANEVVFLNPHTCGIYKSGGIRYKTDPATGKRTKEVDNELAEVVDAYLAGNNSPAIARSCVEDIFKCQVLVPRYFDSRWDTAISEFTAANQTAEVSLGKLAEEKVIQITGGHGSPSNDQRTGDIPYVKVSDIRSLRVNVNPTNLVSRKIAESFWGGPSSGLQGWDLITPNRASSNIGEFAILLPGEEQIVITKEVFVIRVIGGAADGWDPFYLFWALCLKAVRRQWQRVTLMQTNREDCGNRYLEVLLPAPKSREWAAKVSAPFRDYFTALSSAKANFSEKVKQSGYEFIASVTTGRAEEENRDSEEELPLDNHAAKTQRNSRP